MSGEINAMEKIGKGPERVVVIIPKNPEKIAKKKEQLYNTKIPIF